MVLYCSQRTIPIVLCPLGFTTARIHSCFARFASSSFCGLLSEDELRICKKWLGDPT